MIGGCTQDERTFRGSGIGRGRDKWAGRRALEGGRGVWPVEEKDSKGVGMAWAARQFPRGVNGARRFPNRQRSSCCRML